MAQVIEDCHDALIGLIKLEYFNGLSHIDLLRKFDRLDEKGYSKYFSRYESLYEDAIFDVLSAAADSGIAVELNTQGIDKPYGRPFLSQSAVNYCAPKNIPLTFGSDAHKPEEVGRHFDIAAEMFAKAGVHRLVYFRELKPEYWSLT